MQQGHDAEALTLLEQAAAIFADKHTDDGRISEAAAQRLIHQLRNRQGR
jgi:hypothetical protein